MMRNQPNKIFLQVAADGECQDFEKLVGVSWCEDRINDDDLEYISVSNVFARIKELENQIDDKNSEYSITSCRFAIKELKNLI